MAFGRHVGKNNIIKSIMFLSKCIVGFVYIVSSFLVIKSEVIHIKIKKLNGPCLVSPQNGVTIIENADYTLEIESNFIIDENNSTWKYGKSSKLKKIQDLPSTSISIVYVRSKSSPNGKQESMKYTLSYTEKAVSSMKGRWNFTFAVSESANKNPFGNNCNKPSKRDKTFIKCHINVNIVSKPSISTAGKPDAGKSSNGTDSAEAKGNDHYPSKLIVILLSVFGIIIVSQAVYIIAKCKLRRDCTFNKKMLRSETTETVCSNVNDRTLDITQRPPLPLPTNEINIEDVQSPRSPEMKRSIPVTMSPSMQRREDHIVRSVAAASPQPIRNQYEQVNLPMPLQPPTPRLMRNGASPKPSPILSPKSSKRPQFQAGHQKKPPPIVSPKPKKCPVFQAEHHREQDSSEDEWQYETLQPLHHYIKNNRNI